MNTVAFTIGLHLTHIVRQISEIIVHLGIQTSNLAQIFFGNHFFQKARYPHKKSNMATIESH